MTKKFKIRNRVIVLGDQLDHESVVFDNFNSEQDEVWMAEVKSESTHVPSHKARSVLFLSAMRHFCEELKSKDIPLRYIDLDSSESTDSLTDALAHTQKKVPCEKITVVQPGEYRVLKEITDFCQKFNIELEVKADDSFMISTDDFMKFARERSGLRMEYFYRWMRLRMGILMKNGKPVGNQWNFDKSNRSSFGKSGPAKKSNALSFEVDSITKQVIKAVNKFFPDNPGSLERFAWPVTREQAQKALKHFIRHHLASFGAHQDAMWSGEPFLNHSLISSSLNLKLIRPKEVIEAAEAAYESGQASLESVEGFIRQILGWREYVRGVYHMLMPQYLQRNQLKADGDLPEFYWTANTSMNCLKEVISQTLEYGYAHHIQRLMVTGLYGLLSGVDPKKMHEWYLSVYVDAVEWVELPNTLGMSQFADGGVMASKPYIASGKYISRMSNYCKGCRYSPDVAYGENACPFTTLFWDFVDRHRSVLARNPRLGMQVKNWDRMDDLAKRKIKERAQYILSSSFD